MHMIAAPRDGFVVLRQDVHPLIVDGSHHSQPLDDFQGAEKSWHPIYGIRGVLYVASTRR